MAYIVLYIYIQGAAIRPIGAPGEIRSRTYDPRGSQWDRTVPSYRYTQF